MREKKTDIQNERKGREKRKTDREMNRQQNGKLLKMETYQSKYTRTLLLVRLLIDTNRKVGRQQRQRDGKVEDRVKINIKYSRTKMNRNDSKSDKQERARGRSYNIHIYITRLSLSEATCPLILLR